jgi:hypothetical protein
VDEVIDQASIVENLREGFSRVLSRPMAKSSFRAFRGLQFLTYTLLFVLLLLAIGGETAWKDVVEHPGLTSLFYLLVSAVDTVFSARGLAALGSYALLNLFFAIYFLQRYRKILRRTTSHVKASLKGALGAVWEQELKAVSERLDKLRADVQSQISEISALQ